MSSSFVKFYEMSNASGPSTQEKLYNLSVEEGKKTLFFGADRKSRLTVDFESAEFLHRLKTSGRQQTLPKALGVSKGVRKVLDASGGLGGDAFVLASLGCELTVFERNPVLFELLEDGLNRALNSSLTCKTAEGDAKPIAELAGRITLNSIDVKTWEGPWEGFEAGFFDPMYSERNRKSLPRLEMQIVDHVVGEDLDQLEVAEFLLKKLPRLVIKRPLNQGPLIASPRHQFEGSTTRYDVYFS